MNDAVAGNYGDLIAERIRESHAVIASQWLDRLRELLPVGSNEIFPTTELLDHIPSLIRDVSEYVRAPETESVAANTAVLAKAQELGRLRYAQKASVHQLLQEYRILGAILSGFVREQVVLLRLPPSAPDTLDVLARLQESVGVLLQTTVDTFVAAYADTIARQTTRLEGFSRMVSHELRQPLGALQYAAQLLESSTDDAQRERCVGVIGRNVKHLITLTGKLETLCLLGDATDTAHRQETDVGSVMEEVARQLREMADARGVDLRVLPDAPVITLDVARAELILVNLASNAIKYSDPARADRMVELGACLDDDGGCVLRVRDNGLGIDPADLPSIFKRSYRAHAHLDDELGATGSGLGLFIAQECVIALQGQIEVESAPGVGTTFTITLPPLGPDAAAAAVEAATTDAAAADGAPRLD